MRRLLFASLSMAITAAIAPAAAHHSFAIYDMAQNIEFTGVVETVKLRNPHAAMTLVHTKANGERETINFVETAPANMLVRMGVKPEMIEPGQTITTIGAPRRDDPNAYFLKAIILADGTKFTIMN